MTPTEVLETLEKKFNIIMDRRTLLNYEKAGLVPPADRNTRGQGGGKRSVYSSQVIEQAFASFKLLHGQYQNEAIRKMFGRPPRLTFICVKEIRAIALERDLLETCDACKQLETSIGLIEVQSQSALASEDVVSVEKQHVGGNQNSDTYIAMQLLRAFAELWRKQRNEARMKMRTP